MGHFSQITYASATFGLFLGINAQRYDLNLIIYFYKLFNQPLRHDSKCLTILVMMVQM
jgi:hypothetical protein